MFKLVFISTLFFSLSSFGSPLKEYCDNDPKGELYSELWDGSIEDALRSMNLEPEKYSDLILEVDPDSVFDFARKTRDSNPEIFLSLKIRKLEICVSKGFEDLKFYQ